jgi:hypothetical protein
MVEALLIGFGSSCRDDADQVSPECVSDDQESTFDHADQDVAILAVILAPVLSRGAEGSSNANRAASKLTPWMARF